MCSSFSSHVLPFLVRAMRKWEATVSDRIIVMLENLFKCISYLTGKVVIYTYIALWLEKQHAPLPSAVLHYATHLHKTHSHDIDKSRTWIHLTWLKPFLHSTEICTKLFTNYRVQKTNLYIIFCIKKCRRNVSFSSITEYKNCKWACVLTYVLNNECHLKS